MPWPRLGADWFLLHWPQETPTASGGGSAHSGIFDDLKGWGRQGSLGRNCGNSYECITGSVCRKWNVTVSHAPSFFRTYLWVHQSPPFCILVLVDVRVLFCGSFAVLYVLSYVLGTEPFAWKADGGINCTLWVSKLDEGRARVSCLRVWYYKRRETLSRIPLLPVLWMWLGHDQRRHLVAFSDLPLFSASPWLARGEHLGDLPGAVKTCFESPSPALCGDVLETEQIWIVVCRITGGQKWNLGETEAAQECQRVWGGAGPRTTFLPHLLAVGTLVVWDQVLIVSTLKRCTHTLNRRHALKISYLVLIIGNNLMNCQ